MKLPKRGQKGFTLIELLVVVTILGILAAVIIPNVGKFMGKGKEEARKTEKQNVQLSVTSLMTELGLNVLPHPIIGAANATNSMAAFPDATSGWAAAPGDGKATDAAGTSYAAGDKVGYTLWLNDENADAAVTPAHSYVANATTAYWYTCDADGTVHQFSAVNGTEYTD